MRLVFDVETDGLLPDLTKIHCIVLADADAEEFRPRVFVSHIEDAWAAMTDGDLQAGLAQLLDAEEIVAHFGISFDVPAINQVFGPDTLDPWKCWDTGVMARLWNPQLPSHSLEAWGERLRMPKGTFKGPWDTLTREMIEYCIQDVRVTWELHRRLRRKLAEWGQAPALELGVARIIWEQEQNGFGLDVPKARALLADLRAEQLEIEARLQEVFPPIEVVDRVFVPKRDNARLGYKAGVEVTKYKTEVFNPGSRQQVAKRLTDKYGWKPTKYTPAGQAAIDEPVLSDLEFPEAKEFLRYLRLTKQIGMVEGWLRAERNGRVHGRVNTCGAVTGRMTHFEPNMGQVDKKDLRMREVWIPRPGWVLVGCDAEGLEARIMGHYLQPYDGGAFIKTILEGTKEAGTDLHTRNQKNTKLWLRDEAKRLFYADIYGAGDQKLGKIVLGDARLADKLNPEDSPWLYRKVKGKLVPRTLKDLGSEARARLEAGIEGFQPFKAKVRALVKKRGWIKGLDGRRVRIRSEHAALNSVFQSGGAVVMKAALLLFWRLWGYSHGHIWALCANVHDEAQNEADPQIGPQLGKDFADCIRLAGEELGVRCPLAGAYQIGQSWRETH